MFPPAISQVFKVFPLCCFLTEVKVESLFTELMNGAVGEGKCFINYWKHHVKQADKGSLMTITLLHFMSEVEQHKF